MHWYISKFVECFLRMRREAAYALIFYLEGSPHLEFDPPSPFTFSVTRPSTPKPKGPLRIIELGSGTGIVGLKLAEHLVRMRSGTAINQAAGLRSSPQKRDLIILTDLDDVCPLLEENLDGRRAQIYGQSADNSGGARDVAVEVRPLAWGNYQHASAIVDEIRRVYLDTDNLSLPLTHIVCSDLVRCV